MDTELYDAWFAQDLGKVKELLNLGKDVNAGNDVGWTPLHISVAIKDIEIMTLLLEHGADLNLRGNIFKFKSLTS